MRNQIRLSRDATASRQVITDEVGEENPIWFAERSARTTPKGTPTWRATIDEIWSAVHLGVCPGW